jgi:hypothetical protein
VEEAMSDLVWVVKTPQWAYYEVPTIEQFVIVRRLPKSVVVNDDGHHRPINLASNNWQCFFTKEAAVQCARDHCKKSLAALAERKAKIEAACDAPWIRAIPAPSAEEVGARRNSRKIEFF